MSERKPTALFVGRFQPWHKGHMLVVQGMAKLCDKIVIAVGSSEKSNTADNPFTYNERVDMIQRSLQGVNLIPVKDIIFMDVPDHEADDNWTEHVLEKSGRIDQVWTGNEWTKKCFEGTEVEIKDIKEVPGISSTEVRRRIREMEDWKELVPPEVAAVIIAIDGAERIRKI